MLRVKKADFEQLSDLRLRESQILLNHGCWAGAYYLAGYAVESALKATAIGRLKAWETFPEKSESGDFYQHKLDKLRTLAQLDKEMDADAALSKPWAIVKDWSSEDRYTIERTETAAREFVDAITNEVVPWIKAHW